MKMFDAENWIFRRKSLITFYKFHPFLKEIGFSERKKMSVIFLYWYDIHENSPI